MRPLTILVDLDEIVVDLLTPWLTTYNGRHGDDLTLERIRDWDLSKFCRARDAVFRIIEEPGFYLRPKPLPGALDGLRRLEDAGHQVLLASKPVRNSHSDKAAWVERWLTMLPHGRLVLLDAKDALRGDVLFDDGPHNIRAYRAAWPGAKIATIEYPYNVDALADCDLVAGHYTDTADAWDRFCTWIEAGAPRGA